MQHISTIPALCGALALFWCALILHARRRNIIGLAESVAMLAWVVLLAGWGFASAHLARSGFLRR